MDKRSIQGEWQYPKCIHNAEPPDSIAYRIKIVFAQIHYKKTFKLTRIKMPQGISIYELFAYLFDQEVNGYSFSFVNLIQCSSNKIASI